MSWDLGFAVDVPNKLVATDTTLSPKQIDPRHVVAARADEALANVYEQITRVDEEIARAQEQLSKREQDATRHPSDPPQTRMDRSRPAVPGNRPSLGGRAVRGLHWLNVGSVHRCRCHRLAVAVLRRCGQADYREVGAAARPDFIADARKPGASRAAEPSYRSGGTAKTAPPQPAPLAQTAPEGVAPTAAALSPELTQLLQSMARDLATMGQRIEQLKTSQEQMARDNANARRAAQGGTGRNGPRHCHGFRAEPAAQDTRASATADSHPDAQAGVDAPVAESHSAAACRKNAVVIRAAGADAPALAPLIEGQTWENLLAFLAGTKAKCQPGLKSNGALRSLQRIEFRPFPKRNTTWVIL